MARMYRYQIRDDWNGEPGRIIGFQWGVGPGAALVAWGTENPPTSGNMHAVEIKKPEKWGDDLWEFRDAEGVVGHVRCGAGFDPHDACDEFRRDEVACCDDGSPALEDIAWEATNLGKWTEEWTPKVGDRVKLTQSNLKSLVGKQGTILRIHVSETIVVVVEGYGERRTRDEWLELVPRDRKPSARPDWLTDEMFAEMRRLEGTSREEPKKIIGEQGPWDAMHSAMYNRCADDGHGCWLNGKRADVWLTEAGHKALAAIEAEETAGRCTHFNWTDSDAACPDCGFDDDPMPTKDVATPTDWTTEQRGKERIMRNPAAQAEHEMKTQRADGHAEGPEFFDSKGAVDQTARDAYIALAAGIEEPLVEEKPKCSTCDGSGFGAAGFGRCMECNR